MCNGVSGAGHLSGVTGSVGWIGAGTDVEGPPIVGLPQPDAATSTDRQLWASAAAGDAAAFGELFERHARLVWNHAYRLTGSWEQAEDLTSNAFLVAWRRRSSVTLVHDSALPWLYTVVGNLVRESNRGSARRSRLLRRLRPADPVGDHADSVVARIDDAGDTSVLLAGVQRLPSAQRRAVELCLIGELTSAQAAAVLGVSEVTVRSNLSRGRSRLRDELSAVRADGRVS